MSRDQKTWPIIGLIGLWVCLLLGDSRGAHAQEAPGASRSNKAERREQDLEAIQHASRDFVTAFDRGDAAAVAAHWSEDGDFIDETGRTFAGREAIQQEYARFFAAHPGVKMQVVIDAIRLLSSNTAIEDGRAMLDPAPPGAPASSKYTAVHVKVGDKWWMSTVRESRIETTSAYLKLADLEWLVGTWTAEEQGAQTEAVCRWVANKSFLQRSYAVTRPNQPPLSGVQLIGFHPQTGRVQSWIFASDGGHAVGVWTARENGWSILTTGVSGDGTQTRAVNHLTRLDDNAYAWQSRERSAGDEALPDTEEVVLKRKP